MTPQQEIALLREDERLVEAANAAADRAVYPMLAAWPLTNADRMAVIETVRERYGALGEYGVRAVVDGCIVAEHNRRQKVVRAAKVRPKRRVR